MKKVGGEKQAPTREDVKLSLQEVRQTLPVFGYRQLLLDVIKENQVVVVVGETGSASHWLVAGCTHRLVGLGFGIQVRDRVLVVRSPHSRRQHRRRPSGMGRLALRWAVLYNSPVCAGSARTLCSGPYRSSAANRRPGLLPRAGVSQSASCAVGLCSYGAELDFAPIGSNTATGLTPLGGTGTRCSSPF